MKSIKELLKIEFLLNIKIYPHSGGVTIPHEKGRRWRRDGFRKSLGAVLESYDTKEISDFPDQLGIRFDIKTKRHKSIEMMFQKRVQDLINLARDDIFD